MDRPEFPPRPLAEVLTPDDYAFVREKLREAGETPAEDVFLSEPALADRQRLAAAVRLKHPDAESLAIRYLFLRKDRAPAFSSAWVDRAPASHTDPLGSAAVDFIVDYTDRIDKYEAAQEAKKRRGETPQPTATPSAAGSSNSS